MPKQLKQPKKSKKSKLVTQKVPAQKTSTVTAFVPVSPSTSKVTTLIKLPRRKPRFSLNLKELLPWLLLAVGLLAAATATLIWVIPNYDQIVTAITPQPERFTELYFEDHLELPTTVTAGQPFEATFTVHNLEGEFLEYQVEVYADNEATDSARIRVPLTQTSFKLLPDEFETTPLALQLPTDFPAGRAKITVNLIDQNQTIHFWVRVISATGQAAPTPPRPVPSPSPTPSPPVIFPEQ